MINEYEYIFLTAVAWSVQMEMTSAIPYIGNDSEQNGGKSGEIEPRRVGRLNKIFSKEV